MARFCVSFSDDDTTEIHVDLNTDPSEEIGVDFEYYQGGDARSYDGPYDVIPDAHTDILLDTGDRYVAEDITVRMIPRSEVSNLFGGTTFIIGD